MAGSLGKNFAYNAGYQLLLILTPIVTTPYLSRVLGSEAIGVWSFTNSIANYFVMFAVLGMSTYGVREIARCGADRQRRSRVFWSAYASQLAVSLVVIAAYLVYLANGPQGGVLVAALWGLWVLSAAVDASWLFFGCEEFGFPTAVSAATKVAGVVFIFAFVHTSADLWAYVLAISGAYLLNQVLLWPRIGRFVDLARPTAREVAAHLKPSFVLFLPVIAVSLYTSMDKIMLGAMSGMVQTGYYEYSEKLSKMPLSLVTAMGTVMLPRMAGLLAQGRRGEAVGLLGDSVWVMLAMAFAFAFGIAAISPEFATVFLGEEFAGCWVLMCVLACVLPLISTSNVLGRQYLLPTGRDRVFTLSVCVGAAVNIVVNLLLIPPFGALGAAIATVAAEGSVLAFQALAVRGELPLGRYLAGALPFAAAGFVMLVAVRLVAAALDAAWGMSVAGLVIEILVGVVVYAALSVAWCALSRDSRAARFADAVRAKLGR